MAAAIKKKSVKFPEIKFKPKTKAQYEYCRSISENIVTCCTSPAGCGKTFLAVAMGLQHLFDGRVDKILFTRPMVNCGDGLGWLKGGLSDKFDVYVTPLFEEAIKLTDKATVDTLIADKTIQVLPCELLRGMNFHKTFMILDEVQNATYNQIKLFLTRIGSNSKAILSGDISQTDIDRAAFSEVLDKLQDVDGIGIVRLTHADIIRSDIVGRILAHL